MSYAKPPLAAIFNNELHYMLEMHFAFVDYHDISFAQNYFHAHKAYNTQELEATDYFNGLNPLLVGSFRIVIPMEYVEYDFLNKNKNDLTINFFSILGFTPKMPHGKC